MSSFWRETKDPEGVQQDSPGREPWAFMSRPCGASFAPETSLRQSEGDQGITKTVVVFVASTRRDDDKLLAGLDAFESHGGGVAARRKPCYPEFAAVVLIEGPKTTVVCGGNEDQTAGRYDRAAQVGRARRRQTKPDQIIDDAKRDLPSNLTGSKIDGAQFSPGRLLTGKPL